MVAALIPPRHGEGDRTKCGGGAGATGAGFTVAGPPPNIDKSPSPFRGGIVASA
jgi:hypothetical protein